MDYGEITCVATREKRGPQFRIILFCCLCLLVFAAAGCAPLRKKFIRKKKRDAQQNQSFIPVLEPLDYPQKVYSPEERYRHHYSLWKVWDSDLLQAMGRGDSDKRQKYLLGRTIEQLEEMRTWLTGEKGEELAALVDDLRAVQRDYEKPASVRNEFSIRRKIERHAKKIRTGFAPGRSLPYRGPGGPPPSGGEL